MDFFFVIEFHDIELAFEDFDIDLIFAMLDFNFVDFLSKMFSVPDGALRGHLVGV